MFIFICTVFLYFFFKMTMYTVFGYYNIEEVGERNSIYVVHLNSAICLKCDKESYDLVCDKENGCFAIEFRYCSFFRLGYVTYIRYDEAMTRSRQQ